MSLIEKVRKNISEHSMIEKGESVLLSFSGGPDSTALFHVLADLRKKLKFDLIACYFDHRLRPKEAAEEIVFCKRLCKKNGVMFRVVSADIKARSENEKRSLEEAGRDFRRENLDSLAEDLECDRIALGHHRDDQVETILFRLFRGTGPGGLNPIRPVNGKTIRPLYNISRVAILEFLDENGFEYKTDRSNLESKFSRNYIRNEIIPVIENKFGEHFREALLNSAKIIHEQDRYLRGLAEDFIDKKVSYSDGGKFIVDLAEFGAYDLPLKRVIVKLLLERASGRPGYGSYQDIERALGVAEGKKKAENFSIQLKLIRDRGRLFLFGKGSSIKERTAGIPSQTDIEELNRVLIIRRKRKLPSNAKRIGSKNRAMIDAEKITEPIFIRKIRKGDRFRPYGMKGSKKVGDFLTDRKVAQPLRDEIPVLADQEGIIWVVGQEIDDRVKVTQKTGKVLEIEYTKKARRR